MNKIINRPLTNHIALPATFHPIVKRVLAARHINNASELDYSLKNLLSYNLLLGITDAVNLLSVALSTQARILIVADYDADGATSCAVAIQALRQMGGQKVGFLVPNREKHGYGLTPEIVKLAQTDSFLAHTSPGTTPDLLITVDNGISSIEGVKVAKELGMRVLITDHHLPGKELPKADAIINPRQEGDNFPSKNLSGVGVIFYVMMALRAHLRDNAWFTKQNIPEPNLALFLDLVALGTVADVVILDYNNRILIEQGLQRIRKDLCCPGIRGLIQVSGREQSHLVASDLGFQIGPRLNSVGRLDDMSYGIACLLSENNSDARQHVQLLQTFNEERHLEEEKMKRDALKMLDTLGELENLPFGLCLLEETWHQGLIGLIASRLKDRLHRPVVIFTYDKNNHIRGSGRSIRGVHLREILDTINMQHPTMIIQFGGHAMAAGLTIRQTQFETFQQAFDTEVRKYLSADDLEGFILTDGTLTKDDLNLELAEELRQLTPWGQDFPEAIFDGEFELLSRRLLKEKHLKMQVRSLEGGQAIDAIAFNTVDTNWFANVTRVKLAYKLDVNLFRGFKTVQLMVSFVEPVPN